MDEVPGGPHSGSWRLGGNVARWRVRRLRIWPDLEFNLPAGSRYLGTVAETLEFLSVGSIEAAPHDCARSVLNVNVRFVAGVVGLVSTDKSRGAVAVGWESTLRFWSMIAALQSRRLGLSVRPSSEGH